MNELYISALPLIVLSLISGLHPIAMKMNNCPVLICSKKFLLITIFHLIIYSSLVFYVKMCGIRIPMEKDINMQGAKYYIYLSVICAYASGIASLFKTSTFKQVLDTLNSVDDMLRKTSCKKKVSYKKVIMYQVAYMIVENASLLSVMVICCRNLSLELCAIVIYPEILQKVALYQFCFSVEAVYMRSFMLNDEVKSFHKRMIAEPLASSIQRIKLLMKIHMTLLNVANEISTIFNVSNFVLFMNGVVLLILSIYYIYWKNEVQHDIYLMCTSWAAQKSLGIIRMSIMCHLSTTETKRLGIYIHKFLIYNESPELEKEMLIFSEQVLYNGYIYTVGGLFKINGVIVLKMLHFVTTFVIIMIQFQEALTPSFDCSYRTA